MIHIDDLFRQRMEDREASPKPGAWGNMRELLDKQMPVAQAATNWRRVFGYFTGVLLFASASVGGYSLYSDQLQANDGTASKALLASNTSLGSGIQAASTAAAGRDAVLQAPGNAAAPNDFAPGNGASAQHGGDTRESVANPSSAAPLRYATPTNNAGTSSTSSQSALTASASVRGSRNAAGYKSHTRINPTSDNGPSASEGFLSAATAATSPESTRSSSKPVAPNVPSIATASGSSAGAGSSPVIAAAAGPSSPTRPADMPPALEALQSGDVAVKRPLPAIRVLDTIRRIEIVTRRTYMPGSRRPVYHLDTLPAEYAVIERFIPVPDPAPVASAKKQPGMSRSASSQPKLPAATGNPAAVAARPAGGAIVPASAAPSVNSDAVNTANEVAAKLSGSKLGFWKSLRLEERVDAAKASLQSIQLYPGIIAGINATMFTPNSLGGFQLGLSSLIAINDNWSVLGELKYMHRFNTGSTFRDDYLKIDEATKRVIQIDQTNYNEYTWKESKVDHYFNYETIQTIELPIAIRYNSNRFFAQTGVNFVSSRPISAREVTNVPTTSTSRRELFPEASTVNPTPSNSQPNVQMADFGSRLGIGYVFGAGYMFTPSIYLDVRMAQSFWNNATTPGARQISRDLLGKPSFQLSVGYRFGTGKQER